MKFRMTIEGETDDGVTVDQIREAGEQALPELAPLISDADVVTVIEVMMLEREM